MVGMERRECLQVVEARFRMCEQSTGLAQPALNSLLPSCSSVLSLSLSHHLLLQELNPLLGPAAAGLNPVRLPGLDPCQGVAHPRAGAPPTPTPGLSESALAAPSGL